MPASFFVIEPESSSIDACFGRPCANLETTPYLKQWLSWLSAYYGNVIEVVSVIVEERKHAGKHLSVLWLKAVSNNPQSAVSTFVRNKSRWIHQRHLAVLGFWAETRCLKEILPTRERKWLYVDVNGS